jgi:hypothetical protein
MACEFTRTPVASDDSTFELVCLPSVGSEKDIDEVMQSDMVFTNTSRGEVIPPVCVPMRKTNAMMRTSGNHILRLKFASA